MKNQSGYIYLIKSGEHYKIGQSTNVAQRLRQFQLPMPVELLHTVAVPDMSWAEKHLHKRFKAQRVRGEWFTLSPDDVSWICSLETLIEPEPEPEPEPQSRPTATRIIPQGELLSAAEAAEYLGITRARIHAIRESREGFGKQLGKYWYFTKKELDEYNTNKQRPNPSKIVAALMTPVMAV